MTNLMMISVHSVMKKRPSPPSTLLLLLHWNLVKYRWSQKITSPHRQQGSILPDLSPGPTGSTGDDHSYNFKIENSSHKIIKSDLRNQIFQEPPARYFAPEQSFPCSSSSGTPWRPSSARWCPASARQRGSWGWSRLTDCASPFSETHIFMKHTSG